MAACAREAKKERGGVRGGMQYSTFLGTNTSEKERLINQVVLLNIILFYTTIVAKECG